MGVMHGGTPLSVIRLDKMGVTLSMLLDMYGSSHLTIPYLLSSELRNLEDRSEGWIDNIGS